MDSPNSRLINTKLLPPRVPVDLVTRQRLTESLDRNHQQPLILVSAPAGYGKSTLIRCWLKELDYPTAWISLDERDNDLVVFLSYFLAAVQSIFPGSLSNTGAMLKEMQLPPLKVLAGVLINELNDIHEEYFLVIDDYHFIHDKTINELLNELLLFPSHNLHLVLGTRTDPLISLVRMRAQGKVTEIRAEDLRFTVEEASQLLQNLLNRVIDEDTIASMEKRTEGWVTGLRLAAIAMRFRVGDKSIKGDLSANNRYLSDYLLTEILNNQAETYTDWLMKSSIMDRFNPDLLDAVLGTEQKSEVLVINGNHFLEWLEASNMFVIPLDDQGEWFRYHHLFGEFLKKELKQKVSPEEIDELRLRSSSWFAQNGFIEEALQQALAANDTKTAIELVAHNRHDLMNQDKWNHLDHWLNLFPSSIVESNLDLLLAKAWVDFYLWYDLVGTERSLEMIDQLLKDSSGESDLHSAEAAALRSHFIYWYTDGEAAAAAALQALNTTPPEHECVRSSALIGLAGAYQLLGKMEKAEGTLVQPLHENIFNNPSSNARLLYGLCVGVYWPSGELSSLLDSAKQLLKLSEDHEMLWSSSYARYYLGIAHFERNELAEAEEQMVLLLQNPYKYPIFNVGQSALPLGLIYQLQGQSEKRDKVLQTISDLALEQDNDFFIRLTEILQVELEILQGNSHASAKWALGYKAGELKSMHRFYVPELTYVKALMAVDSRSSLEKAAEQLARLQEHATSNNGRIVLIKVLCLQASLANKLGDESRAIEKLKRAIQMAEPDGIIHPFIDLGPSVAVLLNQLHSQGIAGDFISQVLTAFQHAKDDVPVIDQGELIEPLTKRELEILALLAQQLSNQEIADKLIISKGTVTQHTHNIYQKLNVKSRWQAVNEAEKLGLLNVGS